MAAPESPADRAADRPSPPHPERLEAVQVRGRRIATVRHEADGAGVVVFCHGFRGERTGPNRTFVTTARRLAETGIASVRFDQYGSGDSEGDFADSSFTEWVGTIVAVAQQEADRGRRVALLGQSMGASAALCAAAELSLAAVVAWVPDANVDPYVPDPSGYMEEGGQRVRDLFWEEAHAADVPGRFAAAPAPCHLVFGTCDAYVSEENREALVRSARPADVVDVLDGYPHSAWTVAQTEHVIDRSIAFLSQHLGSPSRP